MAKTALPRPVNEVWDQLYGMQIGFRYFANTGVYILVSGVASCATGDWCTYYPNDYSIQRMTKAEVDKLYPLGVAMAAIVAEKYGWLQIAGRAQASLLTLCAPEVALYTTATAGSADDTTTSQTKINRAVNLTVVGGSTALSPVQIMFPSAG
jgi:hypothetical protein